VKAPTCPLCGSAVIYTGTIHLECDGPTTCPNAAPADRRPTQPKMPAVKIEGEFDFDWFPTGWPVP
jgi:hypothetical protein